MNEKTFHIGGRTFSEADLNEPGTRVNPEAIIRGDMYEVAVGLNGEVRHLTLITGKGPTAMPTGDSRARTSDALRKLSIPDVAEALSVTERTVRSWISSGQLRAFRYGPRCIRIDIADLDAFREQVNPAS